MRTDIPEATRAATWRLRASLLSLAVVAAVPATAQPGGPPIVDTVTFTGNHKVADAAVATAIAIRPGTPLAGPQQVKADLDRIVALYRARGLDLAISPDIGHPAAGHLTLRYLIDEQGQGGDAGGAPPGPPPPPPSHPSGAPR